MHSAPLEAFPVVPVDLTDADNLPPIPDLKTVVGTDAWIPTHTPTFHSTQHASITHAGVCMSACVCGRQYVADVCCCLLAEVRSRTHCIIPLVGVIGGAQNGYAGCRRSWRTTIDVACLA